MDFSDDDTIRKMARIFYDEIEKIQVEKAKQTAVQMNRMQASCVPIKRPRREQLADQHTNWFMDILRDACHESFVHGYRHAVEDCFPGRSSEED